MVCGEELMEVVCYLVFLRAPGKCGQAVFRKGQVLENIVGRRSPGGQTLGKLVEKYYTRGVGLVTMEMTMISNAVGRVKQLEPLHAQPALLKNTLLIHEKTYHTS